MAEPDPRAAAGDASTPSGGRGGRGVDGAGGDREGDLAARGMTPTAPLLDGAAQVLDLLRPVAPLRPPGAPWRKLFRGSTSRERLAHFAAGDPLGLWPRCATAVQRSHLVVHLDRLHLRAIARSAYEGQFYGGKPPLETWLDERVEQSLLELLREDLVAEL